jgi:hypothetical protein
MTPCSVLVGYDNSEDLAAPIFTAGRHNPEDQDTSAVRCFVVARSCEHSDKCSVSFKGG